MSTLGRFVSWLRCPNSACERVMPARESQAWLFRWDMTSSTWNPQVVLGAKIICAEILVLMVELWRSTQPCTGHNRPAKNEACQLVPMRGTAGL